MRGLRTDPERAEVRMLLRAPLRNARVLEIGCGEGRLTRRIAGIARSVTAIDLDAAKVSDARRFTPARHRGKVRVEVGSAESLRFPDQSFEVVLFSWSL